MRSCEQCGNPFTSRNKRVRFCSPRCWYDTQIKPRMEKKCLACGRLFLTLDRKLCSQECYDKWIHARWQEANPNWKGGEITRSTGNDRARRWFPETLPCEVCGKRGERHHKDSNPINNDPSNIVFLCRKHHMEADGRLEKVREMMKIAQPKAALAAGALQRSKQICKFGHPLSGSNVEIGVRGAGKTFRVCAICRRRRDRLAQRARHGFKPYQPGGKGRRPIDTEATQEVFDFSAAAK